MVSNYVLGTIIGALIGGVGTLGMGLIHLRRTQIEQKNQNKRVRAEYFAEKEAEALEELSVELERCYRLYGVGARRAAKNQIGWEEYKSEIEKEYTSFELAIEKACMFLSEDGEYALRMFLDSLIGADLYIMWKAEQGGPVREKDAEKILMEEENPSNVDFDWRIFNHAHDLAKEGIKKDVNNRMRPIRED